MYASRNITLCTKDCLCLFVCPTGATDTESGQIDKSLCIDGCRQCVDACPSHAIYLVTEEYPKVQTKDPQQAKALHQLMETKSVQMDAARSIAASSENPGVKKLAKALERSCRILGEDCARESGFMMPQADHAVELLNKLGLKSPD
jgi:Fe-S-cluster-containing hydrogenase component 2